MNMKNNKEECFVSSSVRHRTCHNHLINGKIYLEAPNNPSGHRVDVSDRMLLCSSSNLRNEVVVGGADHALYSINIMDQQCKPITMYNKKCGHTDWVTTVTHLVDGKVLSGSMDGKLCLWSEFNRSQCIELQNHGSSYPISKVISDTRYNLAMSCNYNGKIAVWKFHDDIAEQDHMKDDTKHSHVPIRSSNIELRNAMISTSPLTYLSAHVEPVLECGYMGNVFVSGDKSGSMIIWDLTTCEAKHKFRAHPGPITAVDCMDDRCTVITTGTDGYVKIWDPRAAGSGLVAKIPAHVGIIQATPSSTTTTRVVSTKNTSYSGSSNNIKSKSSKQITYPTTTTTSSNKKPNTIQEQSMIASGPPVSSSAISCLGVVGGKGSSSDLCYIVTGGGSAMDSSLSIIDIRQGYQPITRYSHHRNGVYSLCIVGNETILSGDGMGTLFCHSLLTNNSSTTATITLGLCNNNSNNSIESSRSLKYGIGASEQGAVRTINCLNNKVITSGEDGKVLIFDYNKFIDR